MLMHEITGPGEGLKEEDCERKKVVIREPVKVFYYKRSKRGSVRVSSGYKAKCSYIQKFIMPSKMVVTPAFFFTFISSVA